MIDIDLQFNACITEQVRREARGFYLRMLWQMNTVSESGENKQEARSISKGTGCQWECKEYMGKR